MMPLHIMHIDKPMRFFNLNERALTFFTPTEIPLPVIQEFREILVFTQGKFLFMVVASHSKYRSELVRQPLPD